MLNKKCVLLSGPAGCGKGVLTEAIKRQLGGEVISCKTKLHDLVCEMFCLTPEFWFEVYEDREKKETRMEELSVSVRSYNKLAKVLGINKVTHKFPCDTVHLSPRQAMIFVSEVILKPTFGRDYLGRARAKLVEQSPSDLIIDDSCAAFKSEGRLDTTEVDALVSLVGQDNVLLIRIYRNGNTYKGDSRLRMPTGVIDNTIDLSNDEDEESYTRVGALLVELWYKSMRDPQCE